MLDRLLDDPYFRAGLILLAVLLLAGIPWVLYELRKSNQAVKSIIITILLIIVYRIVWNIPLPGFSIDTSGLGQNISDLRAVGFIGEFVTLLSGGSFIAASVLSLGLLPYGMAQMTANGLAFVRDLPLKLNETEGREFLTRWTMYLILPFAILESFFLLFLLRPICSANIFDIFYRNQSLDVVFVVRTFAILVAGSMFAVWISELISEHGIKGQGSNLIIFAGVIGEVAKGFTGLQSGEMNPWSARLLYASVMAVCIMILIYLARGKREVRLQQYGRRDWRPSARDSLPLQVNLSPDGLAGANLLVGLSIIYLPVLTCIQTRWMQQFADGAMSILDRNIHLFGPIVFTVVFFFTFIFTENQFMASYYVPRLMAASFKIPGINSRDNEYYYLRRIQRSITIPNALGLAFVSIVPWAFLYFTNSTVSLLDAPRWVIIVGVINAVYWHIQDELQFSNNEKKLLRW